MEDFDVKWIRNRLVILLFPFLIILLMVGCGPSAEERMQQTKESATATAVSWTPTPLPPLSDEARLYFDAIVNLQGEDVYEQMLQLTPPAELVGVHFDLLQSQIDLSEVLQKAYILALQGDKAAAIEMAENAAATSQQNRAQIEAEWEQYLAQYGKKLSTPLPSE